MLVDEVLGVERASNGARLELFEVGVEDSWFGGGSVEVAGVACLADLSSGAVHAGVLGSRGEVARSVGGGVSEGADGVDAAVRATVHHLTGLGSRHAGDVRGGLDGVEAKEGVLSGAGRSGVCCRPCRG